MRNRKAVALWDHAFDIFSSAAELIIQTVRIALCVHGCVYVSVVHGGANRKFVTAGYREIYNCNEECGDRLLAFPCLLYYFYRNVQWCRWFAYLHMYACLFVPVIDCTCARISCMPQLHCRSPPRRCQPTQFSDRVDLVSPVCYRMTKSHVIAAVFKLGARDFSTLSSQTLLNKDRQCCES